MSDPLEKIYQDLNVVSTKKKHLSVHLDKFPKPNHKLINKLIKIGIGKVFSDSVKLLYEQALIIEGLKPDNPSEFVKRLNEVLNKSL